MTDRTQGRRRSLCLLLGHSQGRPRPHVHVLQRHRGPGRATVTPRAVPGPTHVLTVRRTDGAAFGLFGQMQERVAVYGQADLDRRIQAAERDGEWTWIAEPWSARQP